MILSTNVPFLNVNVMRCQMKFTSALTAGCGAKCRTLRLELSHSSWSSTTNELDTTRCT